MDDFEQLENASDNILKRWISECETSACHKGIYEISEKLWNSSFSEGRVHSSGPKSGAFNESSWASLKTPQQQARYTTRILGGHQRIPPSSMRANKNECPTGGGPIQHLDPVQLEPSKILYPGSVVRRLIVQLPPGAGKTCLYLDVMSKFIGRGYTIVVVGDPDIFIAFQKNIRNCPTLIPRRLKRADGSILDDGDKGYEQKLSSVNPGMDAFCALKGDARVKKNLQGPQFNCINADSWIDTKVVFFDFVRAGNWMEAWSAGSEGKKSKYHAINPYSSKLLLVIDEAHKLGIPSQEQTTPNWKRKAALFPKYLHSLGTMAEENPYILAGTATVNTTTLPSLSLCLPTVIKGVSRPSLWVHNPENFAGKPQLNLHTYLDPNQEFVKERKNIRLRSVPPTGKMIEEIEMPVAALTQRLDFYKGFQQSSASLSKAGGQKDSNRAHPCPVTIADMHNSAQKIYDPIDTKENREAIFNIWGNVAFVVDQSHDYRYYPKTDDPYPLLRGVEIPNGDEYVRFLKDSRGHSRWTELSQFANQNVLKTMVQDCLQGNPINIARVEIFAPKWKAAAEDMMNDPQLKGRTMIYPGAFFRTDCDDNYYLLLLAFYLQAKLKPKLNQTFHQTQHQIYTLDDLKHGGEAQRRQDPKGKTVPGIFIVSDSSEGKYKSNDIKKHHTSLNVSMSTKRTLNAADVVCALGETQTRARQLQVYNKQGCPGAENLLPMQSANHDIIIIAEGGHKSLDLECTTNGLILSTMPGGKFEQTQGRVKRRCAFKNIPLRTDLWKVHVRVYLLWEPHCLQNGAVIDQALHRFYEEQHKIIRYLEMLEAMVGIGCSKWELYSNWKKHFQEFGKLKLGGFRCVHDKDTSSLHKQNEEIRDMYYCDYGYYSTSETPLIRHGIAGDVDAQSAAMTSGVFPAPPKNPEKNTAAQAHNEAMKIAAQHRFYRKNSTATPVSLRTPNPANVQTFSPLPKIETPTGYYNRR